jgi:hypothetical protein
MGVEGREGSCCSTHWTNGLPVYFGGHEQMGLWLLTWHKALMPQLFGQGSWHLLLMQAKL